MLANSLLRQNFEGPKAQHLLCQTYFGYREQAVRQALSRVTGDSPTELPHTREAHAPPASSQAKEAGAMLVPGSTVTHSGNMHLWSTYHVSTAVPTILMVTWDGAQHEKWQRECCPPPPVSCRCI